MTREEYAQEQRLIKLTELLETLVGDSQRLVSSSYDMTTGEFNSAVASRLRCLAQKFDNEGMRIGFIKR